MSITSPGRNSDMKTRMTLASIKSPLIEPSSPIGAPFADMLRPVDQGGGLEVAVRDDIRKREPFEQRPWLRIMSVTVDVSSLNTRRSGSSSIWLSNYSRRFLKA